MLYSVPQLTCFLLFLSQPNPWNGLMLVHPVHPPLPTWGRCSNAQVPKMSQMLRCCTTGLPDACKPTNPSLPSESWTSTWFTVCGSRAPHSAWEHCRLPQQSCHLPGAGHLSSSNCDFQTLCIPRIQREEPALKSMAAGCWRWLQWWATQQTTLLWSGSIFLD